MCGSCLPDANECVGNALRSCTPRGAWGEPSACPPDKAVCSVARCVGVTQIAAGADRSCVQLEDGRARCWGSNQSGMLGLGSEGGLGATPQPVQGLDSVEQLALGPGMHSCALARDATIACWGLNDHGQVAPDLGPIVDRPISVPGVEQVAQVAVGWAHTCVRGRDGSVRCWGSNEEGQLGDGTRKDRATPTPVRLAGKATHLASGDRHVCAVLEGARVSCWGWNLAGQAGSSQSVALSSSTGPVRVGEDVLAPVIVGGLHGVDQIALGRMISCARQHDGAVLCWGGKRFDAVARVVEGISGASDLTVSGGHGCVLASGGAVRCWGSNAYGELGDGTNESRGAAVHVLGLSGAAQVGAGPQHTCALVGGGAQCWGWNGSAQLGDGARDESRKPVVVRW